MAINLQKGQRVSLDNAMQMALVGLGWDQKLFEFLSENTKYPQIAKESGVQGRVFVNFVVEPNGSISNVKVLRGIGSGCDEEAMRVVKLLPCFNPGKKRGEPVRVSYTLPVVFKL